MRSRTVKQRVLPILGALPPCVDRLQPFPDLFLTRVGWAEPAAGEMTSNDGILQRVRKAAAKRLLFLPHAIRAMARPTPIISRSEVAGVVLQGDVIEDYPEDVRGHSCLMMAAPEGRAVHVVCSPKADYLAVITAYLPDPAHWSSDSRKRKS